MIYNMENLLRSTKRGNITIWFRGTARADHPTSKTEGIGVVTYPFLSMIALQEQRSRFFESLLAAPEVDAVEPEEG